MEGKLCAETMFRLLADVDIINHLNMISAKKVKYDTSVSRASELLMDIHNPCLILEEKRLFYSNTWDIVMKTLKSDHMQKA